MKNPAVSLLITVALLTGAGAALADEEASLSPQAKSMLAWLQKSHKASDSAGGAAAAPLTEEAARQARTQMHAMVGPPTQSMIKAYKIAVDDERIAGVPVKWLNPPTASDKEGRIAVYIHGGGYTNGEPLGPEMVALTHQTGLRTASIDYRLAPEHPFPAGRDDCLAVYRELVRRFGALNIVMYGDSAGGGMVLATVLAARDANLPLPAAIALMSPWSDLTRTGDSYYGNEGRDPILDWPDLQSSAAAYAGGRDWRSPELSPVYADYRPGFPPTLITTGTRDLFLSNSVRLYRAMRQAGVKADLEVWDGMWHVFEAFTVAMPESTDALSLIADFLNNPAH